MLYCILNDCGDIIGRFKSEYKAIFYVLNCIADGNYNINLQSMTKEEYLTYVRKQIEEDWKNYAEKNQCPSRV